MDLIFNCIDQGYSAAVTAGLTVATSAASIMVATATTSPMMIITTASPGLLWLLPVSV